MDSNLTQQQIAPLLDAVVDDDAQVCLAALRAVVRLRLTHDAWKEFYQLFEPWLEAGKGSKDLDSLEIEGLPFWEILEAAVYFPLREVRSKLYNFLYSELPETQFTRLQKLLIQAGDEEVIGQLLSKLDPNQPKDWTEVAPYLYRTAPPIDIDALLKVTENANSTYLKFWLGLALAARGETSALKDFFNNVEVTPVDFSQICDELSPLFITYADRLHLYNPLSGEMEEFISEQATQHGSDAKGKIAQMLLGKAVPAEVDIESVVGAVYETDRSDLPDHKKYSQWLKKGMPISPQVVRADVLKEFTPHEAGKLVTLAFSGALGYAHGIASQDAGYPACFYGNFPASAVYELGSAFQPDLDGMVQLYLEARRLPAEHLAQLDDQIAWTIARDSIENILAAAAPKFYVDTAEDRASAGHLIERVSWLESQMFPYFYSLGGVKAAAPEWPVLTDVPPMPLEQEKVMARPPGFGMAGGEKDMTGDFMGLDSPDFSFEVGAEAPTPVINTGWVPQSTPDQPLRPVMPLKTGKDYYFWLDVDYPSEFSAETTPTGLQKDLPVGARLTVTVVGYHDSLVIDPKACTGELEVLPGGFAKAVRQPLGDKAPDTPGLEKTLYFPVKTPEKPGAYRLRCNIYYGQLLLQSRLATAFVQTSPKSTNPEKPALHTDLDYHLTAPLDAEQLAKAVPHKLSMQLNANGDGTHSFHFKGASDGAEFKEDDVRFGEGELQGMIEQARATMQKVSWDKPEEWQDSFPFKYQDHQKDLKRLAIDLINLAKWGYEFYSTIADRLAGGPDAIDQFEQVMQETGYVQIALKGSPSYILPAAIIYDYPLDTAASVPYKLCPDFMNALNQGKDLEQEPCFNGACPTRLNPPDDLATVCPSGFWGFRHYLGLPLSLDGKSDAPLTIPVSPKPRFLMGEYTDFNLVKAHKDVLEDLPIQFTSQPDRGQLLKSLKDPDSELIYFYCHGGLVRGAPYLVIGSEASRGLIQSSNFKAFRIRWSKDPHPLVFLNGCHTSAVEPLAALTLLRGFILEAQAAGLIGTEITIYEELAKDFAEAFFPRLLEGQPVGKALRGARLVILSQFNPLGLVYTPFVQAGLYLTGMAGATAPGGELEKDSKPGGSSMGSPGSNEDDLGFSFDLPGM